MIPLITKSLIRGLKNFKLRLFFAIFLIFTTAMSGVMIREFADNAEDLYLDLYDETNLADIIVETDSWMYKEDLFLGACNEANNNSGNLRVEKCETRIYVDGRFERSDGVWIPALVYGHVPDSDVTQLFPNGNFPLDDNNDEVIDVIIDNHVVEQLGVKDGDLFLLNINDKVNEFRIKSSGSSPLHLWFTSTESVIPPEDGEFVVIYMDVGLLAEIIDVESDMRNMMLIDLKGTPQYDLQNTREDEGTELKIVKDVLSEELKSSNIEIFQVLDRGNIYSVELLRQDLGGAKTIASPMIILLSLVSGFVLAISMDRLIMAQRREIGTLRILGVDSNKLLRSYVSLALIIGSVGSFIGVIVGYLLSDQMVDFYFGFWGIPTQLLEKQHSFISILQVGLFIVGVVSVSSFIVMRRAGRVSPLEFLRPEVKQASSKFLNKYVMIFPVSIRIGLRSTLRKPKRVFLTVMALGLAILMLGGMLMTMFSMFDYYGTTIEESEKWDARLYFPPDAYPKISKEINENGLEYEFVTMLEGRPYDGDDVFMVWGLSDSLESGNENVMHEFIFSDGGYPIPDQEDVNVVIDKGSATILDWNVGDVVKLEIMGKNVDVKITGLSDELERNVWMYDDELAEIIDMEIYNVVMVRGEGIENLVSYSQVIHYDDYVNAFRDSMENFASIFIIFILIGMSIAVAVLFNTLIINITEKDQEFATMSVLGFNRRFLTKILIVENVVIGVLGGIVGVIVSIITAEILIAQFISWSFYFEASARFDISLMIFGFVMVASLLFSFYGYWRIKNIDIVEKSRFE